MVRAGHLHMFTADGWGKTAVSNMLWPPKHEVTLIMKHQVFHMQHCLTGTHDDEAGERGQEGGGRIVV
eukprot:1143009-Pelagomonas_calceolata.AAC.7